jgi:pilus assembly protein FimV
MNTRLKATLLAASIAALPFGADAAGLGRLNVMSALGQPLRAEVELFATAQELQSLTARVPSQEAFKQANVAPAMTGLRLVVEQRGGRPVLKISSDKPVNAPFVDLVIELNWTGGQVLRDYTFLLDPAEMAPTRAAVDTAVPVTRPQATTSTPRASKPAAEETSGRTGSGGGGYEVQRGDTLRRIAGETRPEGVSLDQMTVALFRGNRSAFDGDNINRLKAGKILTVPDAATAQAISSAEARKEIVAHSADFEGYRRNLAAAVAAAPAQATPAGQESGGKITPKVNEPAVAVGKDQVKVSSLDAAKTGDAAAPAARLQALEEDIVARDKALRDANARLAELEKSIQELQKLVELKSSGMAQAQQSAQGGAAPATSGASTAAPADAAAPAATQTPATPAPENAAPPPKAKPAAPARPVEEPGFMAALLSDPMTLVGGGGILALLLGYAGFKMRSRRQEAQPIPSQLSGFPEATSSVFGAKGGQSVDTGNSSILHTDFSQSNLASVDADEGVDPVAEADVYMAYGRDAQAEEILIDALKVDPSRGAIYVKLLEIYAHRKSLKQFESLIADFYSMTGGKGPDWERAAAIGSKLDPNNPMYGGAAGVDSGLVTAGVAAGAAATGVAASAQATAPAAAPMHFGDPPASVANSAARVASSETTALDFNLDMGSETLPGEFESAKTAVEVDHVLDATTFDADAFGLEADALPAAETLEFEPTVGAAARSKMADLSATVILPVAKEATDGRVMDLERTSVNADMLNFDFDAEESSQQSAPTMAVDLSDIDLNLDAGDQAGNLEPLPLDLPEKGGAAVTAGSEELNTKLELARAYEDLGDREGAKELLAEVLKDGTPEQQNAARALLGRLG